VTFNWHADNRVAKANQVERELDTVEELLMGPHNKALSKPTKNREQSDEAW